MEIKEKKAFMFYLNWVNLIDEFDDQELRRFINNLVKYHQGEEVDLQTKTDRLVWHVILPALQINEAKYNKKVEANRENGKQGGAPFGNQNASKGKSTQTTQNNPNNLIIDNREEITGNSKVTNDKREVITGNSEMETGNWKVTIVENENLGMILKDAPVEDAYNYKRMHIYPNVRYNGKKLSRNEFNALSEADQKDYKLFLMDLDPKGKNSEDRAILGW
jgi:hypothetical protein